MKQPQCDTCFHGAVPLFFMEKGSGTPLVLLHGNGEDSGYFSAQIAYFSKFYRVIAIDTRGHGKSPRGDAPFTLEQFADDLKAFLEEHGLKRVHLLGFSDGGNIALLFALKYPEYVKKLILNGANLSPAGVKRSVQLPIIMGWKLVSLFAHWDSKAILKKELLGLMVTQPNINPESLKKLNLPVLVLVGTKDMIKPEHSQLIADSLPKGELCVIQGDHFIAAKNSVVFNSAVKEFLEKKI